MQIETLKNILKNGGATLNKKGQAVNFSKGFQVSKKDCFILKLTELEKIRTAATELLEELKSGEFLGLWVDGGLVYVDISQKIKNFNKAKKMGLDLKQLSIFNWASKNCIFL